MGAISNNSLLGWWFIEHKWFRCRYGVKSSIIHDLQTIAASGDWQFLELNADSVAALGSHVLDHTKIRYAGQGALGSLRIDGDTVAEGSRLVELIPV